MPDSPREPDSAPSVESRRITFAAARVADHAALELSLLQWASLVRDDRRARELELRAEIAYRDYVAISEEHGLGS
jgi:hypothetical protein